MNTYLQKHKLKILLAVFLIAFVLPLFSLTKTASADAFSDCYGDGTGKTVAECTSNLSVESKNKDVSVSSSPSYIETYLVIPLLKAVLKFVTVLLNVAETVFTWIVNPATMKAIMTNSAVYTTWRAVRDVFNVVFIMVLLFSAFATVFQVSKYNYKNVLLNLVLMALLVNFSYPIARVIIDFSNIIMYGFLQSMGGDNSFMSIIEKSGLKYIWTTNNPDAFFLLSAIIFTFILAITLIIIAVLLVIRTVSLTIYIIFSPLAFVGSVLPGTKLASAGNDWWTDFMKNCFAGPIIVFMLYVANVLMSAMASSHGNIANIATEKVGNLGTVGDGVAKLVTGISTFALPVIVLWLGIIQAQKSGIAGANAVVSAGKKAGKWLAKNPLGGSVGFISKKSGLSGAVKQKWEQTKKNSWLGSEKTAQREATMAARMGVKGAVEKDMRRRADEYKKNYTQPDELKDLCAKGDAAACYRLAEDKDMDQTTYNAFTATSAATKNPSLTKAVNSKVKQNRVDIVANNRAETPAEINNPTNVAGMTAANAPAAQARVNARRAAIGLPPVGPIDVRQYIANQQMGNLSAEQWNDQNWTDILQMPVLPANATAAQVAAHPGNIARRNRAVQAAQTAWASINVQSRNEIRKRLSGNNNAALASVGIV